MKSNGKKQSMFMKIMSAPIRILSMAGDSYIKSMECCAAGVAHGGAVVCPAPTFSHVPTNFSFSSNMAINDEKLRELPRQMSSKRSAGDVAELNLQRQKEVRWPAAMGNSVVGRSYSVGLGKIWRIDEENPCHFEEDLLYPRSRSHAIRNFVS